LVAQKKAGRIRHLGFSSHGSAETIDRFLNWRKNCFELVQIQLNYLDWTLQDAAKKYEVITRHGLAVVAMEPVRGGRLATLKGQAETILKAARPDLSIASWALRFLQALPNVLVVLSGMSTMEQVTENVELFSNPDPMSEAERETLQKALASIADVVPCTECRYCCEDCPQNLDIPKLISMYNEFNFGNAVAQKSALAEFPNDERPSACVSCGTCAKLCPQGIDIPGVLKAFAAAVA
jgi:predicted aldo/keto reductase-like oxidoreductase